MKTKNKNLTEQEIDQIIIADADNNSAWEEPIKIRKQKFTSLSIPSELASRAAFFARLHRGLSLEEWLNRVIQERLDIEEAAFSGFKRELAAKNG
ncbi:MAG: hypothetical protein NTX36_12750 [Proteobacteria bacterium]|nr:hypothetical protein [Pseudomonadota bacterium]